MSELQLIGAALAGMAAVLFLIVRVRIHAFVALLIGSLVIGIGAGMPFESVLESITTGIGSTLASVAAVVGLGAMFGRMLEISGGARSLADSLIRRFGENNAQYSLLAIGQIVAIAVFFDVAFIILVSLVFGIARRTGRPIVYYALPLLAGIAVSHAFIPPTPGPVAVATILGADLGWVILFGLLTGIPAAVVAGPVYARLISRHVSAAEPDVSPPTQREIRSMPGIGLVSVLIATPLALIVCGTIATAVLSTGSPAYIALTFIGHPTVALLIAALLSFWLLGTRCGYSSREIQSVATRALEPAGVVIFVTGAGGALKQVLVDSSIGEIIASTLAGASFSPILLAFLVAAIVRFMQGSATVAMLTAAGIVAAVTGQADFSAPMTALVVIAIAAGATMMSHVNDSGFWLVSRYLGLSVTDTLKTWTVTTTIVALVSILLILGIAALIE